MFTSSSGGIVVSGGIIVLSGYFGGDIFYGYDLFQILFEAICEFISSEGYLMSLLKSIDVFFQEFSPQFIWSIWRLDEIWNWLRVISRLYYNFDWPLISSRLGNFVFRCFLRLVLRF